MKKIFEFTETVEYIHSIEVEISERKESEYESFADEIANKMSLGNYGLGTIVREFENKFGSDNVEFCEDESPNVKFEAI